MSKFIYRMQNILNLKMKTEDQAKQEFMVANQRLREEEEKREALQKRKENYEIQARRFLTQKLQVDKIRETNEAILRMDEFIHHQEEKVEEAKEVVKQKSEKLAQLMQERKAQEKLKEKAFENFVKEENAREGKEIDELVSFTYGKRQREE